ncbi:MAG: DUF4932 domain-containing protein [Hymenobacter sp.]|nr:DUF4932 domain-containing protein [Hymenobacter sp.]
MKVTACLLTLLLFCSSQGRAQAPVNVMVYPGTELLQVIHLLSDTAQLAKSTYNADVLRYFHAHKRHPAVLKARALKYISCDFPVRLSWAFYNFPAVKLATMKPEHMDGYEKAFDLGQMQAYFQECVNFYNDTHFWAFYQAQTPHYARWVVSFERGLYQDGMLATIDKFYRLKRDKPIVFTLGALNCGSYVMSDLRGMNPNLPNQTTIMVAYSQVVSGKDSLSKTPAFYAPARTSQITWHELGHAYISPVFRQYQQEVQALEYIMQQDSAIRSKAVMRGGWTNYLNENTTQAVTSLLRIRTGKATREVELEKSPDEFYLLSAEMLGIIERQYYGQTKYRDFKQFFPVLLAELKKSHPKR